MQAGLQVSVIPDEDSSIYNLGHTYHFNDTGTENETQETPFDQSRLISDPFVLSTSILPGPAQEPLPIPISMTTPVNQWTPPCGEIEMLGGQQLPPFQYMGSAYTGMSPAPMMAQGNTTPSNSSMDDLGHTFPAPQHQSQQAHYYNPPPVLDSTHSNNPSLGSLSSLLSSAPPELNVLSSPTDAESQYSLSRHSSMASLGSLYNEYAPQMEQKPFHNFNTPGKMGRVRSNSRVAPYSGTTDRQAHGHGHGHGRSASISSSISTSGNQQYWTSPSGQLEKGLNNMSIGNRPPRMSLHHRRTSSRTSANWPSISSTSHSHSHSESLSSPRSTHRIKQSASMSTLSTVGRDTDIIIPRNISVADRTELVQQALMNRAQLVTNTQNVAQQDKARSQWVRQWLKLCYTPVKGVTVLRPALFASYEQSCLEYGVKAINNASFGKAMKGAYPGIKTRRLGRRGNSKYHYIDIGPSIEIEARRLNEYDSSRGVFFESASKGTFEFQSTLGTAGESDIEQDDSEHDDDVELDEDEDALPPLKRSPSEWALDSSFRSMSTITDSSLYTNDFASTNSRPSAARRHTTTAVPLACLNTPQGHTQNVNTLPGFPGSQLVSFAMGEISNWTQLWQGFCEHIQVLIDSADRHDFLALENHCRQYWSVLPSWTSALWQRPTVSMLITRGLAVCFDHISDGLVVNITRGAGITPNARYGLMNMAQSLHETMDACWETFDPGFKDTNLRLVSRFAHVLRRISSLSQLSERLSTILANPAQVEQMIEACDDIDAQDIADQVTSMSPSIQEDGVHNFLEGLQEVMEHSRSTHRLASWLNESVKDFRQEEASVFAGSVYTITSELIRDLALRFDGSLSLFQILKLWIDEYVGIVAGRQTMLATILKQDYCPLTIDVPQSGQNLFEGDQATAVPPQPVASNPQMMNPEMDLGPFDSSIDYSSLGLGTPFHFQSATTPRQSTSSMMGCVEPKTEPFSYP